MDRNSSNGKSFPRLVSSAFFADFVSVPLFFLLLLCSRLNFPEKMDRPKQSTKCANNLLLPREHCIQHAFRRPQTCTTATKLAAENAFLQSEFFFSHFLSVYFECLACTHIQNARKCIWFKGGREEREKKKSKQHKGHTKNKSAGYKIERDNKYPV